MRVSGAKLLLKARPRRLPSQGRGARPPRKSGSFRKSCFQKPPIIYSVLVNYNHVLLPDMSGIAFVTYTLISQAAERKAVVTHSVAGWIDISIKYIEALSVFEIGTRLGRPIVSIYSSSPHFVVIRTDKAAAHKNMNSILIILCYIYSNYPGSGEESRSYERRRLREKHCLYRSQGSRPKRHQKVAKMPSCDH